MESAEPEDSVEIIVKQTPKIKRGEVITYPQDGLSQVVVQISKITVLPQYQNKWSESYFLCLRFKQLEVCRIWICSEFVTGCYFFI